MEEYHGSRRRSPYWNHFYMSESDDRNRRKATCKYCPQVLSCLIKGCTGNLARHIRQKHPNVMTAIEEEQANQNQPIPLRYNIAEEDNNSGSGSGVFLLSVSDGDHSQEEVSHDVKDIIPDLKRTYNSEDYESYVPKKAQRQESDMQFQEHHAPDRFDVFGNLVAMKMRELNKDQMILAEKLINDTLHEAEMNNLNRYCGLNLVQVNMVNESKDVLLNDYRVSSNNLE